MSKLNVAFCNRPYSWPTRAKPLFDRPFCCQYGCLNCAPNWHFWIAAVCCQEIGQDLSAILVGRGLGQCSPQVRGGRSRSAMVRRDGRRRPERADPAPRRSRISVTAAAWLSGRGYSAAVVRREASCTHNDPASSPPASGGRPVSSIVTGGPSIRCAR